MADRKGLVRERGTVRPRSSRARQHHDEDVDDHVIEAEEDEERRPRRRQKRRRARADRGGRRGRRETRRGTTSVSEELQDLNRGGVYVAAETLAIAFDVTSKVLRGVVDRAFDEDYSNPGDVVRGVTNEADSAVYDLVDELRKVPRRLDKRFDDGIRSPRAERGERHKRSQD